jgi:polygalacturonase
MQKLKKTFLLCYFLLMLIHSFGQADRRTYNVKYYGATGDGTTLDSKAINKAIETAAAAGGGDFIIPAGKYLCGSTRLKSNIHLVLQQGSVLIATGGDPEQNYDPAEPTINTTCQDYGHSHFHDGFIGGDSLHDISITGPGMIWV